MELNVLIAALRIIIKSRLTETLCQQADKQTK